MGYRSFFHEILNILTLDLSRCVHVYLFHVFIESDTCINIYINTMYIIMFIMQSDGLYVVVCTMISLAPDMEVGLAFL